MDFGNPMPLNADIVAAAFCANVEQRNPAPFFYPPIIAPVAGNMRRCPLVGFQCKKYCKKCGWQKKHHSVRVEGFGTTCVRDFCGKCGQLAKYHDRDGVQSMGPFCNKLPDGIAHEPGQYGEWYGNTNNN